MLAFGRWVDQIVLDELPDDPGHLVAVHLDDRVLDLDFLHVLRLSARGVEGSRDVPRAPCTAVITPAGPNNTATWRGGPCCCAALTLSQNASGFSDKRSISLAMSWPEVGERSTLMLRASATTTRPSLLPHRNPGGATAARLHVSRRSSHTRPAGQTLGSTVYDGGRAASPAGGSAKSNPAVLNRPGPRVDVLSAYRGCAVEVSRRRRIFIRSEADVRNPCSASVGRRAVHNEHFRSSFDRSRTGEDALKAFARLDFETIRTRASTARRGMAGGSCAPAMASARAAAPE